MSGRVRAFTRGTRALVGLTVAGALVALAPSAAASPVPAHDLAHRALPVVTDDTEGLRVEAGSTFTVDLGAPAVHVSHVATLTNTTPNRVSGGYVTEYYFTAYAVPVVPGATNLQATRSDGRLLSVSLHEEEGYLPSAVIQLSPRLDYRQTQTVQLTYDLPPQTPRSDAMAQVNAAYASFPVFVSADPGLGSVSVVLPKDAVHEFVGPAPDCADSGATLVCATTGLADPDAWYTLVVARQDDALVVRTLAVGDKEVGVHAWPGDTAWLDLTSDTVERGLPVLEELVGRDWTAPPQLDIVETSTPYLYGYAGWYQPEKSLIEIGDDLDPFVTLHELAHAWFNELRFGDRWINEALADEYAALALDEIGQEHDAPEPVDLSSDFAVPLADWTEPAPNDPDAQGRETWGYNTAWWVAHALVDEIGRDRMVAVVQAAIDEDMPYPAPTVEEGTHAVADWRAFLDLAEEVGGSTEADQLFRDYVVGSGDEHLLDARADARRAYAELLDAGDGWAPPATLRRSMTTWSFDDAMAMVPQVADLLDQRDTIAATLDTVGEAVPTALERQFESANDLEHLAVLMDSAAGASTALAEASTASDGASVLTRAGLLVGGHVDTDLATARAAMDDGDWDAARTAAVDASDGLARASLVGTVAAVVLTLLLAAAGFLVVRHRRRGPAASSLPEAREVPEAAAEVES